MCAEQIIEYEDFDNQTGGYQVNQVNEYEYEEEDERYGPVEREGELSLSAEVRAADTCKRYSKALFFSNIYFCIFLLSLRICQKKDKKESLDI